MANDNNSLNSVQLQADFIVDYNPFSNIFEVQKNGKVVFTKKWKYITGDKNSEEEEENDGEIFGKYDKSSVRIFVVYKNVFVQGGSSRRSSSNGLGDSTFWKSKAKSSISSILLYMYSLRSNGDDIETLPGNRGLYNRNAQNGQRDKFIKNVSPKNGKTSLNSVSKITINIKHGDSPEAYEIDVVAISNSGSKGFTFIYDPNTFNRKIKPNYGNGNDKSEIFPRNSDVDCGSDEIRSGQKFRNITQDYGNDDLGFFNKNSTNDNGDDNVNLEKNLRTLKRNIDMVNGKLDTLNGNSTYENSSDDFNSESNIRYSTQNYGDESLISEKNRRNLEQEHGFFGSVSGNKNKSHRNLGENFGVARGNDGRFNTNAKQNTVSLQDNPDAFPPNLDHNFDSEEFFSDVNDMAFEKPGFESLSIFAMLRTRFAFIIEEYFENHTTSNKNSNRNGRTRFQLVTVPSEVFEEAMRQCHIETVELAYSNVFPSDCRMFVGVPIYRYGYIHRKDQL